MNHEYLEISQINNYIKNLIDKDYFLNKVYIKGEISNFKRHSRGHLYFTLKDDNSRINAVMFYSNATSLNFDPVDGNQVLVEGRIQNRNYVEDEEVKYITEIIADKVSFLSTKKEENN